MTEFVLRTSVFIAAVAQIAVPSFINPFRDGNDAVRSGPASQIEPASYAFTIWGAIYLGALAYSVWQLSPAGRADPTTARIAPLAIILYVGSSLWLAAASQFVPLWTTMPILGVMAACAVVALMIATNTRRTSLWRFILIVLPFGLYAGWSVCATFVNIAEVAPQYGFDRFGLSIPLYGAASIVGAAFIAGCVLWLTRGEIAFALTVAWALTAIIVAAQTRGYDSAITITAVAALAAVALVAIASKLRAGTS